MVSNEDPKMASHILLEHLKILENWLKKWKIQVNGPKSSPITFTLRKGHCPEIRLNQETLPQVEIIKSLGMHLDNKLNWREHIDNKIK